VRYVKVGFQGNPSFENASRDGRASRIDAGTARSLKSG
jgi:hypothetical protein